ncbi:MAG: secondary thiamine-phosphate synthase enzyme YjbQ [Thermodesulfobacteriota bacterium]
MNTLVIDTNARCEMIDITARVAEAVRRAGIRDGVCHVFTPHTTAAITINENADSDVPRDMLTVLDRIVPLSGAYRHAEGNTAAHVKASLLGASQTVLIKDAGLVLGTWQALFFCEFDGPRTRKVLVGLTAG